VGFSLLWIRKRVCRVDATLFPSIRRSFSFATAAILDSLYIDVKSIDMDTLFVDIGYAKGQNSFVMDKNSRDPVHCWLVLGKAFQAASKYLYAGLEETGIDDTDFRILEALFNKGPLPVNTIGPKVYLAPVSISVAIDRLLDRGLVSRSRVPKTAASASYRSHQGRELIAPVFRKHANRNSKDLWRCEPEGLRSLSLKRSKITEWPKRLRRD
jgi:MarR family 2-MHQ and catechol resistance regulon transcriptional repressor